MTDYRDPSVAQQALNNPSTPAADLAVIAQGHPSLRVWVATHPNAYPQLLDWLVTFGDDSVRQAVAYARSRTAGQPAPQPPAPAAPLAPAPQPPTPVAWQAPAQSQSPAPAAWQAGPPGYPGGLPPASKKRTGLIIGIVAGAVVLVLLVAAVLWVTLGNGGFTPGAVSTNLSVSQFSTLANTTFPQESGLSLTKVTLKAEDSSCHGLGPKTSLASADFTFNTLNLFASAAEADQWLDVRRPCWEGTGNVISRELDENFAGVRVVTLESKGDAYLFAGYANVVAFAQPGDVGNAADLAAALKRAVDTAR